MGPSYDDKLINHYLLQSNVGPFYDDKLINNYLVQSNVGPSDGNQLHWEGEWQHKGRRCKRAGFRFIKIMMMLFDDDDDGDCE